MDGNGNNPSLGEFISSNRWKILGSILGSIFALLFTVIIGPYIFNWLTREPAVIALDLEPTEENVPQEDTFAAVQVRVYNEGTATAEACHVRVYNGSIEGDDDPAASDLFGLPPGVTERIPVYSVRIPGFPKDEILISTMQVKVRAECNNHESPVLSEEILYAEDVAARFLDR